MKSILFIIIAIGISGSVYAGGPWTQLKGKGYFKLSEWWTVFDQHFTDTGLLDPNVTTGIYNTNFYVEYGVTDRFTTVLNFPLFSRTYMNNLRSSTTNDILVAGEALNSIGDIDLGVKYCLSCSGTKLPVSVSLILGIPTGNSSGGSQNNLQTGDGEFNQMLMVDAGTGFNLSRNIPAYVSAYVGVNNRTENFSEEFRYGVEFGVGVFNKRLWLNTKLNVVESFKNGATAEDVTTVSVFANNTEFASVAFEANYYLNDRLGLSTSVAGALRGEIIAAAPSYSVGVFYDMN